MIKVGKAGRRCLLHYEIT